MEKYHKTDIYPVEKENERDENYKASNPQIDSERTKDNYHTFARYCTYTEFINKRIEELNLPTKPRKDAVLMASFVIGSDREFFNGLTPAEQERFFDECTRCFANKYGKENIISAVVHNDETTPHLHLNLMPIWNGRLCCKDLFNRAELTKLQTDFHEAVGKHWGLARGREGSSKKHLSTAEYKAKKIVLNACTEAADITETAQSELQQINQAVKKAEDHFDETIERIHTAKVERDNDYKVRLTNNKGEEKKTAELTVKDFCESVREKEESAYGAEYKRPSEEAKTAFAEREKALRAAVPDEMKTRKNWVAVKTWKSAEKDKLSKRPIDCNTGNYAESDNPETWTTFDKALEYVREHGGTTVAYALDGKDKVSCVDIDCCFDENGELSETAKEALKRSGATYAEKSVSGNGLHIFGKTNGMDLRTFSKGGDLEFYQKEQFIAMTGDGAKTKDLINFDTCGMKPYLESKCEKRIEWKGVCKGENGLSSMSDKDVVEKAREAKNGGKFKRLYAGEDLQNNHSNSDMSLMNILAYWCNGDKEQMLRIFATSGLFRPNKSADYYEHTAIKALREIPVKSTYTPTIPKNNGGNGKR